jgi:TonB family protein
MTVSRTRHRLAMACVAWLAAATALAGQDTLARAKELYVLAAYDEALLVLGRLHETASPPESTEIAGYQVFCLIALGRTDAAQQAIAALVKADPLYRPSPATTSPRTRAIFEEVRQGLLPAIVHDTYDKAKGAFDRNEPQVALAEFDRVLALIDEPGVAGQPNMADLRRLATGFRDLSKTAAAAAAAPPASASGASSNAPAPAITASPPPAAPAAPTTEEPPTFTSGDAGVVPPMTISRPTPVWVPRNDLERRREFRGVLDILVDERGDVISVAVGKSVHPAYDAKLAEMARTWRFRPATKDGVPVRYQTTIEIRLNPGS